ncbi:MAG: redoxin domain-containing protein [Winogradskyella sp.]
MKKLLTFAITALLLFGCKQEVKTDYVINGTAKGVYNGIRVYLNKMNNKGRLTPIDTAIIMNNTFTFTGKADTPTMHYITVNSVNGRLPILLDNSTITLVIDKDKLLNSEIKGSKTHNEMAAFTKKIQTLNADIKKLSLQIKNTSSIKDKSYITETQSKLKKLKDELKDYPIQFSKSNPDSFIALQIIEQQLNNKSADVEELKTIFNTLSVKIKTSENGTRVNQKLNLRINDLLRNANLQIGKIAPNFEAPTPNGNKLSLNKIKGKVTIIDFWAAWCGPCRKENPNVVNIYNKYHSEGLEIIGVSLDGTSRQKDAKKAWTDAIKKDKLTWHHVSNLNYFNDPIAKLYNINSIPATYILNAKGEIVAKNLRGIALENKVSALLNQ